jgi:hypothetical protein
VLGTEFRQKAEVMANATSTFLQSANAANGSGAISVPDENAVLIAINDPKVSTLADVASQLGSNQQVVTPVVNGLLRSKLIEDDGGQLRLSPAGDLALQFANMAKY